MRRVTDLHLQRLDSKPGVDTSGIYVENHINWNRDYSVGYDLISEIWISEGPPPAIGGPSDV